MTKDFREAVERPTSETPGPIDHDLKQLFDDLKRYTAYTFNITKTLGIDRVYEQRDAAEYFEKILSLTSPEASQIFGGLLTHKNICSQCRTEKDNDERFWHLLLALMESCGKENYSVVNGIEAYFRPSVFSGENQMYCEECDAKSDATNKCVIKHHPEVLMLLLKRFEFDYSHMTYVKVNCTVDVPHTLQIPENQTYELYAVVDHLGDLRSGCYTATIKDDESWYRFNDDKVTLLDYQPFQVDNSEKSSNAYLLFYRKTNEDISEVSTPGGFPPATSGIYEQFGDAGKIREIEEVEGAAEAGNENAEAEEKDTGTKDTVGVWSGGVGRSPEPCFNVEGQNKGVYSRESKPYKHQECNEKRHDLSNLQDAQAEKQKIVTADEEDMGGNAEVGKRGPLSRETQFEESVEDRDTDSGRPDDVRQRRPDINHDYKDEETGDDEQSEKKEVGQDDPGCEQISRSTNTKHEQQGNEKMDVKRVKEQKSRDDNGQDVEDQNNEGLDEIRQNQSEQKITDTHSRHKDVCVEKQAKEQDDEHIQNRADSSVRQAGSSGSRNLTENQEVSSVEKMRHGDPQPKARTEFHEDTSEGRRGSGQSRSCYVKITEEEFEGGIQKRSETTYRSIQTVGGSS
ncbi:probable ubiquitin carboxyl-terminal hydrolase creB [Micropterus salmoides]|uniref:probable ubiquitin carboxyl-terminal hydrolase creB n=1 Tax=Micropterus salmoides TaxID=27706 RepID=UPI0018EAA145|nr:probable ubiquitin carboxyl-terminal hydrolase creB [Micropterus salmoides]XP_038587648.1 probable ubiquitin carboxyl-terminal hydrolase creB [Micropterus salmoides]XP_038587649.1 probable ubiquitin carboxyl-terminal hydrolase creB [Micropterus salmoides]